MTTDAGLAQADLAQRIKDHLSSNYSLDSERREITDAILKAFAQELLPKVEPHLPQGFTIDLNNSYIGFSLRPSMADVSIRLLLNGFPLYPSIKPSERMVIDEINNKTVSARVAFAKRYNFEGIYLSGDPGRLH